MSGLGEIEAFLKGLWSEFRYNHWAGDRFVSMCILLGVPATLPQRLVTSRWLNVYDRCVEVRMLWPVIVVYYYSFLTSVEKRKCDVYLTEIYQACSLEVVEELKKIQKECAESNSMVKGPENAQRKDTIKREGPPGT